MTNVDCVVIGAGVIGVSVGRALALAGHEVLILESERTIGSGASSRNSEVIHAGIYYDKDSIKAETCVDGRIRLYEYCEERHIPYRRCGKLIVATSDEQIPLLGEILTTAKANGVDDLRMISASQVEVLEPELRARAALVSPSSGIVDSHALMHSLLGDAENAGAILAIATRVTSLHPNAQGIEVFIEGEQDPVLTTRFVINAAGLAAQSLARSIPCFPAEAIPPLKLAKGNYFALRTGSPFSRLIYPVPEPGGLGIHFTLDLSGAGRFGPDVEWMDLIDYSVDPTRARKFYHAIRRYWPALRDGDLEPAYAGIRPKLSGDRQSGDFILSGPADHGMPGVINLFGIESPGLTAALSIASKVEALIKECLS